MSSTQQANSTSYYISLTIAIIIGLVGVYLRFAGDTAIYSWISNIIFIIGIALAFRAVFAILK